MKKLIIVALLATRTTTYDQCIKRSLEKVKTEQTNTEQRQQPQLKKPTTNLNLSSDQQALMKLLLVDQSIKRENREVQEEKPPAEIRNKREAIKNKIHEEKKVLDDKMKIFLISKQSIKWNTNQEKMRHKVIKHNRDKRRTKMSN